MPQKVRKGESQSVSQTVTVDIDKEVYEEIKQKAVQKRFFVKDYVNSILKMNVEKDKFLERYAPHLSVDEMQEPNVIILKDTERRGLVDVRVVDSELRCDADESTDCVHAHFVWALPEVAKLNIKRPPTAPKR
jgi:hypothetical protein